tara:strand:+ start:194 stop:961 length:768 start_codon:yes stop_codon:yes gene_type:complete
VVSKEKNKKIRLKYKNISKKCISDEILIKELKTLINNTFKDLDSNKNNFEKNVIDPFSYIFEYILFNKSNHQDWKSSEIMRQKQKEFGNHLGRFHQNLMCSLEDCYEPNEGGVDLINEEKKIIAEIKNKHNSINSGSKVASFDKLKFELEKKNREGFTAYFVTVLPKKSDDYEYKFITTSNKKSSEYRDPNENIIAINAENFYKKITGKENVLKSIYQRIPDLIKKIDSKKENTIKQLLSEKEFNYYLIKAYGKN